MGKYRKTSLPQMARDLNKLLEGFHDGMENDKELEEIKQVAYLFMSVLNKAKKAKIDTNPNFQSDMVDVLQLVKTSDWEDATDILSATYSAISHYMAQDQDAIVTHIVFLSNGKRTKDTFTVHQSLVDGSIISLGLHPNGF